MKLSGIVFALLAGTLFTFSATTRHAVATDNGKTARVYVGTYTGAKSKGIYLMELDLATGKLTDKGLAAEAVNPTFLALHPSQKYLYAVSEVENAGGTKTGAVAAFAINPENGKLTELNRHSSGGGGPCHLVVDKEGKCVLVANYSGGSVASLPIDADGKLREPASVIQHKGSSVDKSRQSEPHAHSINLDPSNRFAFAADLGLDQVLVYAFDPAKGTLTANDPAFAKVAPGSGPRHFAFHPSGKFAYVINEMLCTVTLFTYDGAKGELNDVQTISTLPDGVKPGYSTAEVQVHPSGKFLYGSNRGHHSIAMFTIDQETGKLTSLGQEPIQGKTPRNFGIDPTGNFLLACGQDSHTITVFRINQETGKLTATGQQVDVPAPVCVKFMAMGK